MLNELKIIKAVAPEVTSTLQARYQIMKAIYWMSPIGRRTLAEDLDMTERVLRTETDLLKQYGLIATNKSGMTLTPKGKEIYRSLEELMNQLNGMDNLEERLANYFSISRCVIVEGDSDQRSAVVSEFGKVLNDLLAAMLPEGENIIAVMGGTTMAEVATHLQMLETPKRHNVFVPARGGIGETVAAQANSVSSVMATKSGGEHHALYVPEQLSEETYRTLIQEPSIRDVLKLISQANCVIHSIGRAIHMAARRRMSEEQMIMLRQKNAVAESFGYFFNEKGDVIYKVPRIGLDLSTLKKAPFIFAIAGGKSKGKAIRAYMKNAPQQTLLITDEAAANEILKGVTL